MKDWLRRVGGFLSLMARLGFWGVATVAIAALIALISIPAAVLSGLASLALGWWFRSEKKIGTVFGGICLVGGVIWFVAQPQLPHPPFTSCSVSFVPIVRPSGELPIEYERTEKPVAVDPKPWVDRIVGETFGQLSVIEGAEQRIQRARTAAIAHARDTREALVELDALLEQADQRLKEQQLWDVGAVRQALETRSKTLSKAAANADAFRKAWDSDADVRRVASVALVLTNLDNEIARLFTGIRSSHSLSVLLRGRDITYRETLTLTADGGVFSKIDPSAFLDAARQRGLAPALLWSPGPSAPLQAAPPGALTVPEQSRSLALVLEWTDRDRVVDTCRRMSALPFEGATIRIPSRYTATVRGEVIPDSKTEPVPVAVNFTAENELKELTLPAYSLFVASHALTPASVTGEDAGEQVFTFDTPVTASTAQSKPLWVEMLPTRLRARAIHAARDSLFPANAAITLVLLGIATLGSTRLVPDTTKSSRRQSMFT